MGRNRVSERIGARLESMTRTKPSGLTPQQWQVMVDWTRNLHANSMLPFQTSLAEITAFESRLNNRLDLGCDADAIEWIWDEYATVCDSGRQYQRFRRHVNKALTALNSPALLDPPEARPHVRLKSEDL